MKIEKINENQIRCTLTREDLESHQVNLKELAYGSEKAKKLFLRYDAAGTDYSSVLRLIIFLS